MVAGNRQPVEITCRRCKKVFTLQVDPADQRRHKAGEYAQRAFPYLNADERELLVSRTCGPCYDLMFGEMPGH